MLGALRLFVREYAEFDRFFGDENRTARRLVFYSEKDSYYRFFEGYIDHVLRHSDLSMAYVTSDPHDPLLAGANPRVKAFYTNHLLPSLIGRLESSVLVMTMPDLGLLHVRRSPHPGVDHVYVFHGLGSVHLQYSRHAFDHYDTVFCLGPRDEAELRRQESLHGTRPKVLVPCGYPRVEKIHADHLALHAAAPGRRVLVAPSWHRGNLLEDGLDDLVRGLEGGGFAVVVRPHPETIRRKPRLVRALARRLASRTNVTLEVDMMSEAAVHAADVLVTDWSAISFEYAFGTERPVLFVDTPCKINNPHYRELGMEPVEFGARTRLGETIAREELGAVAATTERLLRDRETYRERILAYRSELLYNWMGSAKAGGDWLIRACAEKEGRP